MPIDSERQRDIDKITEHIDSDNAMLTLVDSDRFAVALRDTGLLDHSTALRTGD